MTVKDLLKCLEEHNEKYTASGDVSSELDGFSSIYEYRKGTVTWLRYFETAAEVGFEDKSITCLITDEEIPEVGAAVCQIRVEDPRRIFFLAADSLWGEKENVGISDKALIEEGAKIGENTSVGAFTFISSKAVIGKNCRIGNRVSVIGKVNIGDGCIIQDGAILGSDGFAFTKNDSHLNFVKHFGGVTLCDNVSIGANTIVCRGTIDDTFIDEEAKIDNLCHIAHNVNIGKRVMVIAGCVIMGSVHIGDDSWIATSVIRDQRKIGASAVVGMGAVVVKDVPDGITVAGNPAKPFERKEKI